MGRGRGVYSTSVAAELVRTGQQNLRPYERKGLMEPGRTLGGTRAWLSVILAAEATSTACACGATLGT